MKPTLFLNEFKSLAVVPRGLGLSLGRAVSVTSESGSLWYVRSRRDPMLNH